MISKVEARKNVIAYLEERKRTYSELSPVTQVRLERQARIEWGAREGQRDDLFVFSYGLSFGDELRSIFVRVSATSGEVLYSSGPHGILDERELPENPNIAAEKKFNQEIFGEIFQAGDFSFGEGTELLLLYESYEYNLELSYDNRHGSMVYAGMYIRLLENKHAYRLQDLLEYFHPERQSYREMAQPYEKENQIDQRIHAALIKAHLLPTLTKADITWEPDFKEFLAKKQPY